MRLTPTVRHQGRPDAVAGTLEPVEPGTTVAALDREPEGPRVGVKVLGQGPTVDAPRRGPRGDEGLRLVTLIVDEAAGPRSPIVGVGLTVRPVRPRVAEGPDGPEPL